MSQKNILVTGGAGFIGSLVAKMLSQAGYHPITFDNLSTGSREAVRYGTFIYGDLCNHHEIEEVFRRFPIDGVIHFAASTDVGESMINPLKYYENNVSNTINLLQIMRQYHVNTFVFSSSAAIFGFPQQSQILETDPTMPINPYGESKLMVEEILRNCGEAYGLKSCCLRYFNAAGGDPEGEIKNFKQKESNLIPLLIRSLKSSSQPLKIYGTDYPTPDGTCIRDYVHIYDLGTAHILALEQLFNLRVSTSYNLGNGSGFSVLEVIKAAKKALKQEVPFIEGPRRAGDPPFLVADSHKAKKELGWSPCYPSLEKMIEDAWVALN